MPALLVLLALAGAGIDGEAARRHAAALSALGPHPWGSPRAQAAAQYVAAQFRSAGLNDVRLQPFRSHDIDGLNVVGVLPGPGVEWVALGAHHDTAPEAPGAYDDGGGVGVLIEVARSLARRPSRPRTYVFVSWDGEEAWSTGLTTTAGSRAWLAESGLDFEQMVGAFVVEMSGFARGRPCLHPIAYADPRARGRYVIAPAWLVRTALAGRQFAVGDPWLSWIYQPAVRTLRVQLYGDDLSLLQAGRPAVFAADSSFTSFYPWYHQPSDTADKVDAAALARMGSAVLGLADALGRVPRGHGAQAQWFAVAGTVVDGRWLLALGLASLAPGLLAAIAAGGRPLALGLVRTAAFALLLWRHPVPALWVFLLPNLLAARVGWRLMMLAFLPALALVGLGLAAAARGFVGGLWLGPLDLALVAVVAILPWRPRPGRRPRRGKRGR